MTESHSQLDAAERRSLAYGTGVRIIGTPFVALFGLITTSITIRATGETVYGLVALVSTVNLLLPFADLGIGAVVTTAASRSRSARDDAEVVAVVRRAYRTLCSVAAGLIAVAAVLSVLDGWSALLGLRTGPDDRWAVGVAVALFALTLPAGLGLRILIGINKNHLAVLLMMSNSGFGLCISLAMYGSGIRGVWFVLPGLGGVLIGNVLSTWLALRLSSFDLSGIRRPAPVGGGTRLLHGSLWMFVISVGIPFGLQAQRVILAHRSTPVDLSEYALMAQIYAIGWSTFSTAAQALWPVFVKRRSHQQATIALWWRTTMTFGASGVVAALALSLVGPWIASTLSRGVIGAPTSLAIAFGLLLAVQCVHLPSGMLLTLPSEARWQSMCLVAMASVTVLTGVIVAPEYGATGVVLATAAAVLIAQVGPDLVWVPKLIEARQPASVVSI